MKRIVALLSVAGLLIMSVMIAGCGNRNDKPVNTTENYPAKPITIIVPYAAGGSTDMMARAMEKAAVKHLGQSLVVLNIPGGAATIGWNELAGAKPDGYTIGVVANAVILQPLFGPTRYHYPTALDPLVQGISLPIVIASSTDQPWQNINDVINYAKQHPGEIKYAHSGLGTSLHVVAEMFAKEADINITQVPFRGESESAAALLGGHVQLMVTTPSAIKEQVKSGKIKVLAISAEQRLTDPDFKNVPTFKEEGLNVVFAMWYGVAAPKGLPENIKTRLAEGFKEIYNDPELKKNMQDLGMTVEYLGPQEFSEKWSNETVRLTKIVKETGIAERIASQKN